MTDFDIDLDGLENAVIELESEAEQWASDAVWVTGSNVEYGVYLEFGTEDMPPYPWFRPAIADFRRNPNGFIRRNTEYKSIDAIPSADALVKAVAVGLENQMTKNASAETATGRSAGTRRGHPKRQSGNLAGSIQAVRVK